MNQLDLLSAGQRPLRATSGLSITDLYWGLHFALAMAPKPFPTGERLTKLSEGICDLDDDVGIIARIVALSGIALKASGVENALMPSRVGAPPGSKHCYFAPVRSLSHLSERFGVVTAREPDVDPLE